MYSQIAGTGTCLPEKVLTNQDLERHDGHQRCLDTGTHRHREAAYRRRNPKHRRSGRTRRARRHRRRGPRTRRYRSDRVRHVDARFRISQLRRAAATAPGLPRRRRLQHRGGLQWLRLCPLGGGQVRQGRRGAACAGGRVRRPCRGSRIGAIVAPPYCLPTALAPSCSRRRCRSRHSLDPSACGWHLQGSAVLPRWRAPIRHGGQRSLQDCRHQSRQGGG